MAVGLLVSAWKRVRTADRLSATGVLDIDLNKGRNIRMVVPPVAFALRDCTVPWSNALLSSPRCRQLTMPERRLRWC